MPIDAGKAVGAPLPDRTFSWDESDVLLYHLGIGFGSHDGDNLNYRALSYTLDSDGLQVLPSFGVVAPTFHETNPPSLDLPGCDIDLAQVVHGSQEIVLHRPLPDRRQRPGADHDQRRLGQGQGCRHRPGGRRLRRAGPAAVHHPVEHLRARRGRMGRRPRSLHEGRAHPTASPTSTRRTGSPRSRRCSTGSAATATRCTRTRSSPRRPASRRRSCTGSPPTGSCSAPSSRACSTGTPPRWAASPRVSPVWFSRARPSGPAPGTRATGSS